MQKFFPVFLQALELSTRPCVCIFWDRKTFTSVFSKSSHPIKEDSSLMTSYIHRILCHMEILLGEHSLVLNLFSSKPVLMLWELIITDPSLSPFPLLPQAYHRSAPCHSFFLSMSPVTAVSQNALVSAPLFNHTYWISYFTHLLEINPSFEKILVYWSLVEKTVNTSFKSNKARLESLYLSRHGTGQNTWLLVYVSVPFSTLSFWFLFFHQ